MLDEPTNAAYIHRLLIGGLLLSTGHIFLLVALWREIHLLRRGKASLRDAWAEYLAKRQKPKPRRRAV